MLCVVYVYSLPYTIKFNNHWNDKGTGQYNFSAATDSGSTPGKHPVKTVQKEQYNFRANKTGFHANGTILSVIPPSSKGSRSTLVEETDFLEDFNE